MRQQTAKRRRRLRAVQAGDIIPGDRLWSDATMHELLVMAVSRQKFRPDANLYDEKGAELDENDPDDAREIAAGRYAVGIVLLVRNPDGSTQRLGGYAPQARLQVIGTR